MVAHPCGEPGCGRPAVTQCAYEDDGGLRCDSFWCEDHAEHVGELSVCHRHRRTLEIISSRRDGVYELTARPAVADRSLSLTAHLAEVLGPSVRSLLTAQLGDWPDSQVETEQHPRPFWDEHGHLAGWELGWSILSPRGHHLRVAVRARSAHEPPSVQVVAEHLVAYDGELSAAIVRGRRTEAQLKLLAEIERLLADALRSIPARWRPVQA